MKMNRIFLITATAFLELLCPLRLGAQAHLDVRSDVSGETDPRYILLERERPWLLSRNPVAIGIESLPDIGATRLAGGQLAGDLHRSMDSPSILSWGFGSSSYQSLDKVHLWGDFSFAQKKHGGRAWSDRFEPYDGNPYQAGSPIPGDYVEQVFDFGIKLSSRPLWKRIWAGIGLDYGIGDLSRTRDPRSRVQFADICLTPGLAIQIHPEHRAGLYFSYRYRKEKYNRYVTKSAAATDFLLYRQEGLGVSRPIVCSSFDRRTRSHHFGGGLQYGFQHGAVQVFTWLDANRRQEAIEDRQKESPGDYREDHCSAGVETIWKQARGSHTFSATFDWQSGVADKAFQEQVSVKDPDSGQISSHYVTLFTSRAYQHGLLNARLSWNYLRQAGNDCNWYAGADLAFERLDESYIFYTPASVHQTDVGSFTLEGGKRLLAQRGHRLYLEASAGCHLHLSGHFQLSPDLESNPVSENVTLRDAAVMGADVLDSSLRLRYIFPLSAKLDGFALAEGRFLYAGGSLCGHRRQTGISLGFLKKF